MRDQVDSVLHGARSTHSVSDAPHSRYARGKGMNVNDVFMLPLGAINPLAADCARHLRKLEPAAQVGKGGGELGDARGREKTKRRAKRPMRMFTDNSRNNVSWIRHGAQTWGE